MELNVCILVGSHGRKPTLIGISQRPLYGARSASLKGTGRRCAASGLNTPVQAWNLPCDAPFDHSLVGFIRSNPLRTDIDSSNSVVGLLSFGRIPLSIGLKSSDSRNLPEIEDHARRSHPLDDVHSTLPRRRDRAP